MNNHLLICFSGVFFNNIHDNPFERKSSMIKRLLTALYGQFEDAAEVKKFFKLATILGFIIGVYWAMRPLKDSLFDATVGFDYQPIAKMISLVFVVTLVLVYSKLVDIFSLKNLFYAIILIYAAFAFFFGWAFMNPEIGLANTVAAPDRLLGWAWYIYVESFGSIVVALFWAITTDITGTESAKRGFPIIALFAQMGNMIGPVVLQARFWNMDSSAPIVLIFGVIFVALFGMMYYFMNSTPARLLANPEHGIADEIPEPGFLEGLKLLLTQGYLLGMFSILFFYELIITIVDFHFKKAVFAHYATETLKSAALSDYAMWTGIVATLCVMLGINNIQRHLGMTVSLILLPLMVFTAVVLIKVSPESMKLAFWIMVMSKAVNYALNGPTMKQLYIPTTRETKFKAQAWIEMFGGRSAKAGGSFFTNFRATYVNKLGAAAGVASFLTMIVAVSGGVIALWIFAAIFVSKKYNTAIKEKRVVC